MCRKIFISYPRCLSESFNLCFWACSRALGRTQTHTQQCPWVWTSHTHTHTLPSQPIPLTPVSSSLTNSCIKIYLSVSRTWKFRREGWLIAEKISARIKLTNLVLATPWVGDNGMSLGYAIMPHHNILIIACPSECSTPVSPPGQRDPHHQKEPAIIMGWAWAAVTYFAEAVS